DTKNTPESRIRLTPEELEKLIDRVLEGVNKKEELSVEERLKRIESFLVPGAAYRVPNAGTININPADPNQQNLVPRTANDVEMEKLRQELRELRQDMLQVSRSNQGNPQGGIIVQQPTPPVTQVVPTTPIPAPTIYDNHLRTGITPYLGV